MHKGSKVIWNSEFGYELGYFVKPISEKHAFVLAVTGKYSGITTIYPRTELYKYTTEMHDEMIKKYGYTRTFENK